MRWRPSCSRAPRPTCTTSWSAAWSSSPTVAMSGIDVARRAGAHGVGTGRGARVVSDPTVVVDDIGLLVTNDPELGDGLLGVRTNASVVMEGDRIVAVGAAGAAADRRIDAAGRCVLPGFVDSHTHLVFAGDRSDEFAARMAGRPYDAGGINATVAATRAATSGELAGLAAAPDRRGAPGGHHDRRDQVRVRPVGDRGGPLPRRRRRAHRRDDLPRCSRRASGVRRPRRRLRRARCAARC